MTLEELIASGEKALKEAGVPDAKIDARLLAEFVLNKDYAFILANGKEDLETLAERCKDPDGMRAEKLLSDYEQLIGKRAERIPLQHLTGMQDFLGLTFHTGPGVLIPRQDTETLVEEGIKCLHDGMRILDLCTGSGCILISLLMYSNDCSGVGTDLSRDALSYAELNAKELLPEVYESGRIAFFEGDLFADTDGLFDLVVSNPPYIATAVIETLEPEVKDHDPMTALDGGKDGLIFYRRIIEGLDRYLSPGGNVLFEIGYDQAEDVSGMLKDAGYRDVTTIKDLSGNDRVIKAVRPILGTEREGK